MQYDVVHISNLHEKIYSLKQGTYFITKYLTQLKRLWDELMNVRLVFACQSHSASIVSLAIRNYQEGGQVIRFLKGLNESFSIINARTKCLPHTPYKVITKFEQSVCLNITT